MVDYHVHTALCGHADGEMRSYVEQAVKLGLQEIGFSGHFPYPPELEDPLPNCVIPENLFDNYLREAQKLQQEYAGRIKVRIGAEFDYLGADISFHPMEEARRLNLDHCLASVHFTDNIAVDYNPEYLLSKLESYPGGINRLYERYYQALLEMVSPGFCNVVGHLDVVKKFSSSPGLAPSIDLTPLIDKVLDRIAESELVIEINTAGFDKPCGEQYPSYEILQQARERGIRFTLGSDAHAPHEVGRHFEQARYLLKKLGVSRIMRFEGLEAIPFSL